MRKAIVLLICLLLFLTAPAHAESGEEKEPYQAGVARVPITPSPAQIAEGVFLGGSGGYKQRRAAGTSGDIYATALALCSGTEKAVLVELDVAGIGNKQIELIRNTASDQTGVPAGAILVIATHTKSGPDLQGIWGGVPKSYGEYLVSQAVDAVKGAVSNLKQVDLVAGSIRVSQGLMKNGRGWSFTDNNMTVLQFRHRDKILATLVNFAVQPAITESGRLISSDFVGPLEKAVESMCGGTAVFVNGCLGDAMPNPPAGGDYYTRAGQYGGMLAECVRDALNLGKNVPPGIFLQSREVAFKVENLIYSRLHRYGLLNDYYRIREDGGEIYFDSQVTRLVLGDGINRIEMVGVPGEAITRLGVRLREIMDGKQNLILGLTNDSLGCLIPLDEWGTDRNANYEESVSLEMRAGEKIFETVQKLYQR